MYTVTVPGLATCECRTFEEQRHLLRMLLGPKLDHSLAGVLRPETTSDPEDDTDREPGLATTYDASLIEDGGDDLNLPAFEAAGRELRLKRESAMIDAVFGPPVDGVSRLGDDLPRALAGQPIDRKHWPPSEGSIQRKIFDFLYDHGKPATSGEVVAALGREYRQSLSQFTNYYKDRLCGKSAEGWYLLDIAREACRRQRESAALDDEDEDDDEADEDLDDDFDAPAAPAAAPAAPVGKLRGYADKAFAWLQSRGRPETKSAVIRVVGCPHGSMHKVFNDPRFELTEDGRLWLAGVPVPEPADVESEAPPLRRPEPSPAPASPRRSRTGTGVQRETGQLTNARERIYTELSLKDGQTITALVREIKFDRRLIEEALEHPWFEVKNQLAWIAKTKPKPKPAAPA